MVSSSSRITPLLLLAAVAGVAACGGSSPPAAAPAQPQAAPAQPPAAPAATAPQPMTGSGAAAYQQGLSAYASGDLAGAKAAFLHAIQADPGAHQPHYSLGVVLERLDDPGALGEYQKAHGLSPEFAPAIVAYALLLGKRANFTEAESFLQAERGKMPKSAAVVGALAEIKSMNRDTAAAQQLAQEALKIDSNYRPAMVTIARDHYRNRRLDLSLYALQAILDGFGDDNPPRDKDNADGHFLRALILKEDGRRALAITDLKQAVLLRPDLVEPKVELASFYLEAGNATDAQPLLEGALRFSANHVIAHLNLGDGYRLQGRTAEAKAQFDWVLAHDTALAQVHYDMALLYLFSPNVPGMDAKRQLDAAIAEIQKFQEMRGKSSAGQSDDSDELLNRAKQKQADLSAQESASEPAAAPAESAPPAGEKGDGGT
jgi:tetratricopeptide (TPR) repeat protein